MMTNSGYLATGPGTLWSGFWQGEYGMWIITRGVRIALLIIGALLAARFITWIARRITRRIDARYQQTDQLVRTESAKHQQAVASVVSWVCLSMTLAWQYAENGPMTSSPARQSASSETTIF